MGSHSHITVHNISRIYCYTRGSRIRYNILKKERNILRSFAKERNVSAFFPVLHKRTGRSLGSFLFFAKEQDVLYVIFCSFEKNGKESSTGLGTLFFSVRYVTIFPF